MQGVQGNLYGEQINGDDAPPPRGEKIGPSSCGASELAPHDDGPAAQPQAAAVVSVIHESTLARLAERYLHEEVFGVQADATFRAKASDLNGFVAWFTRANQAPNSIWIKQDTVEYIKQLEHDRRAPATINRVLATLKTFAQWAYEMPGGFFDAHGLPTRGVKPKALPPSTCKKLPDAAVRRLVRAAALLTRTRTHANQRPWRDRAMLAVLLHTGLRAHEVVGLQRWQYTGKSLLRVQRKGQGETPVVYVPSACREAVDEYFEHERNKDAAACAASYPDDGHMPLFLANGRAMLRQHLNEILDIIACEAGKNDPDNPLRVTPHMMRHTFGAKHREASGSDSETAAALGHVSTAHVGRYTRKTDDERAAVIEGLF